jgi:ABC-type transporter Mla maintaining outer membrane lipid asymmetry ATPase subunit MlaF
VTPPVLELSSVLKDYRGLRPLRVERLTLAAGDQVAIVGVDGPAAEVLVNLVTGAVLPDRGQIGLFGRPTSAIQDSQDWLTLVDRVGIVSARAVLLDGLTVVQNLAMPFSLDIEPPAEPLRARATALAAEVGLAEAVWERPVAELDAAAKARVRLGRALALDPALLLLEHASADLAPGLARGLGAEIRAIAGRRGAASLALTADRAFAAAVASTVLTLEPATGRLKATGGRWWSRRR